MYRLTDDIVIFFWKRKFMFRALQSNTRNKHAIYVESSDGFIGLARDMLYNVCTLPSESRVC